MEPQNVISVLNYFKDHDNTQALYHDQNRHPNAPPTKTFSSRSFEQQIAQIHDVRGTESQYILDVQGFQFLRHESNKKDFVDGDCIRRVYYPETKELLKEA